MFSCCGIILNYNNSVLLFYTEVGVPSRLKSINLTLFIRRHIFTIHFSGLSCFLLVSFSLFCLGRFYVFQATVEYTLPVYLFPNSPPPPTQKKKKKENTESWVHDPIPVGIIRRIFQAEFYQCLLRLTTKPSVLSYKFH